MAYATYEFYINQYSGGLEYALIKDERQFNVYLNKAELYIKEKTLNKSETYAGKELQVCTCALADKYWQFSNDEKYNNNATLGIASEKVGEYSVSYSQNYIQELEQKKTQELDDILKTYLWSTGLLYRGVK